MFTTSREGVIKAVEALGDEACAYVGKTWLTRSCDCKYGANKIGQGSEQGNGCPELRSLRLALSRMTDEQWTALMKG